MSLAVALSAFVLATLWLAVAYQLHRDATETARNAEVNLVNLTRAFAEHTAKTLEGADQAIRFMRSELRDKGASLDIAAYLHEEQIIGPAYHLLSVIGADGFVTHSSQPFQRTDLRDREHFRVHAQGSGDDRLFISKPVLGRVSGKWSIQLTRRVDAPDHRFGGVVVLSLSPGYLTRFYNDVDLGAQGAIALVGRDAVVRARASRDPSAVGQDVSGSPVFQAALKAPSGVLRARSVIDQVERLHAFRRLDEYGLIVVTGIGVDDMLAEPRPRREAMTSAAGAVTLVVLAFLGVLVRQQRQQLELVRRLEHSNRQAQAANRLKTRFLATVSHELRTPLNGILGYAELIRDTCGDAESREYGAIIHQSAGHLHGLVNTILDLAKIESGRMTLSRAPTLLTEVLSAVHRLHAVQAQQRGLQLEVELKPGCPPSIVTDAMRLQQILNHLVGNAIKFTDHGSVRVVAHGEGDELVIDVTDTGIGIPPERMGSIFSRFESAMTDFTHPGQGAGLGLPLAHELAELLHGTLTLHSVPGAGTTATWRLPAAVVRARSSAASAERSC
jgi:signal transduction histidine kinase